VSKIIRSLRVNRPTSQNDQFGVEASIGAVFLAWLHSVSKCCFQWCEEVDLVGRQGAVD